MTNPWLTARAFLMAWTSLATLSTRAQLVGPGVGAGGAGVGAGGGGGGGVLLDAEGNPVTMPGAGAVLTTPATTDGLPAGDATFTLTSAPSALNFGCDVIPPARGMTQIFGAVVNDITWSAGDGTATRLVFTLACRTACGNGSNFEVGLPVSPLIVQDMTAGGTRCSFGSTKVINVAAGATSAATGGLAAGAGAAAGACAGGAAAGCVGAAAGTAGGAAAAGGAGTTDAATLITGGAAAGGLAAGGAAAGAAAGTVALVPAAVPATTAVTSVTVTMTSATPLDAPLFVRCFNALELRLPRTLTPAVSYGGTVRLGNVVAGTASAPADVAFTFSGVTCNERPLILSSIVPQLTWKPSSPLRPGKGKGSSSDSNSGGGGLRPSPSPDVEGGGGVEPTLAPAWEANTLAIPAGQFCKAGANSSAAEVGSGLLLGLTDDPTAATLGSGGGAGGGVAIAPYVTGIHLCPARVCPIADFLEVLGVSNERVTWTPVNASDSTCTHSLWGDVLRVRVDLPTLTQGPGLVFLDYAPVRVMGDCLRSIILRVRGDAAVVGSGGAGAGAGAGLDGLLSSGSGGGAALPVTDATGLIGTDTTGGALVDGGVTAIDGAGGAGAATVGGGAGAATTGGVVGVAGATGGVTAGVGAGGAGVGVTGVGTAATAGDATTVGTGAETGANVAEPVAGGVAAGGGIAPGDGGGGGGGGGVVGVDAAGGAPVAAGAAGAGAVTGGGGGLIFAGGAGAGVQAPALAATRSVSPSSEPLAIDFGAATSPSSGAAAATSSPDSGGLTALGLTGKSVYVTFQIGVGTPAQGLTSTLRVNVTFVDAACDADGTVGGRGYAFVDPSALGEAATWGVIAGICAALFLVGGVSVKAWRVWKAKKAAEADGSSSGRPGSHPSRRRRLPSLPPSAPILGRPTHS